MAFLPLIVLASLGNAGPRPVWSKRVVLDGASLTIKFWMYRNASTEIEVFRKGRLLKRGEEDVLHFDPSIRPFLRRGRRSILLTYVGSANMDHAQYASVWKISRRGTKLQQLGTYRNADLRRWFSGEVIREIRSIRHETEAMDRAIPDLFDDERLRYRHKQFVLIYHYEHRAEHFQFAGYRIVPLTYDWPERVRFPRR